MQNIVVSDSYIAAFYLDTGVNLLNNRKFKEASLNFLECLKYRPDYPLAHWYNALSLLHLGDYAQAFIEYEYRWQVYDWRWGILSEDIYRIETLRPWRGEKLRDKKLLVLHEQGHGDAIMMLRYLPVLQQLGAQITAVMPFPLQRLVHEQYGIEVCGKTPDDLSVFDFRCPLFGVMLPLRQTPGNIPNAPYIKANSNPNNNNGKAKIGIAWSGVSRKELTLETFLDLLGPVDADLYSLQLEGADKGVIPLVAKDFADTVEVIAQMNHIISIDTAPAHLAGAMGHPSTYVIVPWNNDWRWSRAPSWYPTVKICRQEVMDDWKIPFFNLKKFLR